MTDQLLTDMKIELENSNIDNRKNINANRNNSQSEARRPIEQTERDYGENEKNNYNIQNNDEPKKIHLKHGENNNINNFNTNYNNAYMNKNMEETKICHEESQTNNKKNNNNDSCKSIKTHLDNIQIDSKENINKTTPEIEPIKTYMDQINHNFGEKNKSTILKQNELMKTYTSIDDDTIVDELKTTFDNQISMIESFYSNQTILVTGSTGFLGTLLVEKLLRCCKNINKLILIVRNNKNQNNLNEKMFNYFNNPIFDQMKYENPNYSKQIVIINGELDKTNLNLKESDEEYIISNTTIVFHIGATVKFNEHLKVAFDINVKGTSILIDLAKKMKGLISFVHVSTAYCNCDRKYIDEIYYDPVYTEKEIETLVDENVTTHEELSILHELILENKPNTYTLTKSIAESLVQKVENELPICIFRPSIVMPTLKEPIPLWLQGFNGVLAFAIGVGTGLQRVILLDESISIDIVPADKVTNALTTLAWYQTTKYCPKNNKIFNYISSNDKKVELNKFCDLSEQVYNTCKESNSFVIWKGYTYKTTNEFVYYTLFYLFHIIQAVVFSTLEKLTNRKPLIIKTYRKIISFTNAVKYFSLNEWNFSNQNMNSMMSYMNQYDDTKFNSKLIDFNWAEVIEFVPRSLALYMFNERFTKEKYYNRMYYIELIDNIMWKLVLAACIYYFLHNLACFINYLN